MKQRFHFQVVFQYYKSSFILEIIVRNTYIGVEKVIKNILRGKAVRTDYPQRF